MIHLQSTLLPAIIISLPIILYSAYSLSVKSKFKRKVLISGLVFLFIGLAVPWISTFVSANGLVKELHCVWTPAYGAGTATDELISKMADDRTKYISGATVFLFYGYLINLIGIPFLGFIFYKTGKEKK